MRKSIKSFWKGGSAGKPTKSHSSVDLVSPSPSSPVPSDSRSEISFHSAETNNNNTAGESPEGKSSSLLHPRQLLRRAASSSSRRGSTHSLATSTQQPAPGCLNSHSSSAATAPVPLPTATSTDVIANPPDSHGVSAISTTTNKPSSEATLVSSNIPNTVPLPNSNNRIEISVQISDCQSPLLWTRTLDIVDKELREHGLPALDRNNFTSTSAAENIQSIIATCTVKADQNDEDAKKTAGRDRLKRILRHVDKYTKIVDVAVQHSPEVTSLVWAGIRTMLLISLNHLTATEGLEEAMSMILEKVAMCEFYARIYAEDTSPRSKTLQDILDSALPKFYAGVIIFSVKIRVYFQARWLENLGNMLKLFDVEFGPFIDDIIAREKAVQACADGVTMERIQSMERQLGDLKSEIQPLIALNNEIAIQATENYQTAKQTQSIVHDERTYELLKILSPLEPLKRHEDVKATRLQNTGTWLLQLGSYSDWSNCTTDQEVGKVFCCYGIPGAGKTVISSLIIDDIKMRHSIPSKVGIACLYADYRDQSAQTFPHIVGTLLRQLLTISILPIPQDVLDELKEIRERGAKPGEEYLLSQLKVALQRLESGFICIDALDELEVETRNQFLEVIKNLTSTLKNIRVFLTGRKHIQEEVQRIFHTLEREEVEIVAHPGDIQEYLKKKIMKDPNPDAMNKGLEDEIIKTLVDRSQQMFLLPALHIKMVLQMPTKSKRRKALDSLPSGLGETFAAVISRIKDLPKAQADLGMRVLMWLHVAFRPFALTELQHALSVEAGQIEFDADDIPSPKTIFECCLGLVIHDEESKTVRFVHYTLEEYFGKHGQEYFPEGYCTAAELCLTYILFPEVATHCFSKHECYSKERRFALLEYAAMNWGRYVARQSNPMVMKLVFNLLEHNEATLCPLQVLYLISKNRYSRRDHIAKFHGIHSAAYFGLVDVMQSLCSKMSADLPDDDGLTPLSWAAKHGKVAIVQLLVGNVGADINKECQEGRTPLSYAAGNGHEAIVQLLLARDDVDINTVCTRYGRTPLLYAAERGHEAVVQILLARDNVDINKVCTSYGRAPLSYAAGRGHEAVVRLLLAGHNADINKECQEGRTPLSYAAERGHEAVVQLLLARDNVDINKVCTKYGRTPLSYAAEHGHEAVVQLLLARDDVDINNDCMVYGQTPLLYAAQSGHEAVVQQLLARDDVDINKVCTRYGQTPLSCAAEYGHEVVVQLLLARDDVDINKECTMHGRTPFSYAARNGAKAVLQLLLARDDVDVNKECMMNGQTPLSYAAQAGRAAVVQLLLPWDDVDIKKECQEGQTPLSYAAQCGHEAVVQQFLARDDVDINKECQLGRTPLSYAARNGHEAVVKLLLARDDVDMNKECQEGRTPLSYAAKAGEKAVVQLLLARDDVDINKECQKGQTPLLYAARNRHEAVIKLLLARDDVDINKECQEGRTPLFYAELHGDDAIVQQIQAHPNFDHNTKDPE